MRLRDLLEHSRSSGFDIVECFMHIDFVCFVPFGLYNFMASMNDEFGKIVLLVHRYIQIMS